MQTGGSYQEREEKLETRNQKSEGTEAAIGTQVKFIKIKEASGRQPHPFYTNCRKGWATRKRPEERGPAPRSIPYGQDGAVCIAHHFVGKVPRHVGRRLKMPRAMQAQNDEIGFENVGSQQDLFTRYPVLDHKFRLDCLQGMQIQFLELPLASHSRLISHLREIAGG